MKIECFFSFHAGTRVETLAQQRPRSMEADLDIVFGDFEDICGIGRAHVLDVEEYEDGPVSVRQLFNRFFQQSANLRV